MTIHRFYLPPDEWSGGALVLSGAEAHHCSEVLRMAPGDRLIVFDGQGREAEASVDRVSKREVVLAPGVSKLTSPPNAAVTLAQAIPKGKNMDLVIQKATELGAAGIIPLITERTVVRIDAREAADKQEKWQRVAIEACKQCGQNHLPRVAAPVPLSQFLAGAIPGEMLVIAAIEPGARRLKELLSDWRGGNPGRETPGSVVALIGPEGDFTPKELLQARQSGFASMSLGPIILRTETAAIFTLSTLAHELF